MEREYMAVMNSTISHEMRNPLNSIYSQVDVQERKIVELEKLAGSEVKSKEIFDAFKKSLRISKSSCKLLKFNVEDILALPQLKQGKFSKNV
mmetsp:Transcript_27637/g.41920  ORF Transcript_27637/g.41920 Transcript_27637/m.41920 type:complete len:92 (-) Transcript_27637:242-517(-)